MIHIQETIVKNVADIAKKIATVMNFSKPEIIQIYYAGLVHDIGKALIPKEIINKNGKLTTAEYEIVKEHPGNAYKALINAEELNFIAKICFRASRTLGRTGLSKFNQRRRDLYRIKNSCISRFL